MCRPTATVKTATIRFVGRWLVVHHDGFDSEVVESADEAVALLRRRDARRPGGFAVTVVTWDNPPAGFEVPSP